MLSSSCQRLESVESPPGGRHAPPPGRDTRSGGWRQEGAGSPPLGSAAAPCSRAPSLKDALPSLAEKWFPGSARGSGAPKILFSAWESAAGKLEVGSALVARDHSSCWWWRPGRCWRAGSGCSEGRRECSRNFGLGLAISQRRRALPLRRVSFACWYFLEKLLMHEMMPRMLWTMMIVLCWKVLSLASDCVG